MATLEKIRSKSVFLIVVIGIALLAFIVGDAITNGRSLFGSGSTIASLGDAKVDISEYQSRLNMYQEANPDADVQELSQATIDALINEKLLDAAAKKLGVEVSDEQTTYYIMEQPLQPMQLFMNTYGRAVQQMYPNAQLTPTLMYNIIFTPEKYGLSADQTEGLKQAWIAMEKETKAAAARNIYMQLLYATIQPNDLDKKALFAQNTDSYTVDVARKAFGELDKKKYPVSDADIKAEYDKNKNMFMVKELTKTVGFIAYSVKPSDADIKLAKELQAAALKSVKAGQPLAKDLQKQGVRFDTRTATTANAGDYQLSSFLKGAPVDSVALFDRGGSFRIVKLVGNSAANDSLEVAFVQVMKDQVAAVTADIKAGMALDSLSGKYSADQVGVSPAQWVSIQNEQARQQLGSVSSTFVAALDTVGAGAILTAQETPEGSVLAYVKNAKPKVSVYTYEDTYYDLYPSDETIDAATEALSKYAASHNTPAKFAEGAQKAGYMHQSVPVSVSLPAFSAGMNPMNGRASYYPKSREVVQWVMTEGEPGMASPVFSNEDMQQPVLYIALVEDEYDDYAPYTDSLVKESLEAKVRASKAGDAMVKQYSGKGNIQATAQAMGVPVVTDSQVRFQGSMNVPDAAVAARMTGTKPGAKTYVVKGNDGVYAYEVKAKNPSESKYYESQSADQYNRQFKGNVNALFNMLRGNKRMENNIFKITRSK